MPDGSAALSGSPAASGTRAPVVRKRTFTVRDWRDRERAIQHIRSLPLDRAYHVTAEPYRRPRTLKQNNRFHFWCERIAEHLGYEKWEQARVKEDLKEICDCPVTEYVGLDGTTRRERRTSKLDTRQMMDFEERVLRFAAKEIGLDLPVTKEDFANAV